MKIIYLNIDHGKLEYELLEFLISQSSNVDFICLQEADKPFFDKLSYQLSDFSGFRSEKYVLDNRVSSIAIFVNSKSKIVDNKRLLNNDPMIGFAESCSLNSNFGKLEITNVWGISQPGDKKDNPKRIKQSKDIINNLSKFSLPKIVGGDFNLMPDTTSIKMFEENGYRNLIKDFGIKTTRSKNAWKRASSNSKIGIPFYGKQDFADYIFVSPEIKVINFEVLDVEISDHLPLVLDFHI